MPLSCLAPDEVAEVCVQMRSPAQPGMYQSKWRASTASGSPFGGEWAEPGVEIGSDAGGYRSGAG